MSETLQLKQAKETLNDLSEINLTPNSGGQPMAKWLQEEMQPAFGTGTDFSGVRIHEGPQAEKIGALAYTQGENIHFPPGQYRPTTPSGKKILGHELGHVIQQQEGRVTAPQSKGVAINADPQLEAEADVLGAKAARGEPAQVTETANSGIQRMSAQDNVVQCMVDGNQPAVEDDDNQEFFDAQEESDPEEDPNLEAAIGGILGENITRVVAGIQNAPSEELGRIVEEDSFLSPVAAAAVQTRMLSQTGEQPGSPTNNSDNDQSSTQREILTTEQPEASTSQSRDAEEPKLSNEQEQEKLLQEQTQKAIVESEATRSAILSTLEKRQKFFSQQAKIENSGQSQAPVSSQEQERQTALKPLRLAEIIKQWRKEEEPEEGSVSAPESEQRLQEQPPLTPQEEAEELQDESDLDSIMEQLPKSKGKQKEVSAPESEQRLQEQPPLTPEQEAQEWEDESDLDSIMEQLPKRSKGKQLPKRKGKQLPKRKGKQKQDEAQEWEDESDLDSIMEQLPKPSKGKQKAVEVSASESEQRLQEQPPLTPEQEAQEWEDESDLDPGMWRSRRNGRQKRDGGEFYFNSIKMEQLPKPGGKHKEVEVSASGSQSQQEVEEQPPLRPQQQQRQRIPVVPEVRRLRMMSDQQRQEALTDLQQRTTDPVIREIREQLREIDQQMLQHLEIRRLGGIIIEPQAPPPPATRKKKRGRIGKHFDSTKKARKKIVAGTKHYETYSDLNKILGQNSPNSNTDQVFAQNLPANEANPITILKPIPPGLGLSEKFGNDAAFIGMTRDLTKAFNGWMLLFENSESLLEAAWINQKKKSSRQRIADGSNSFGELASWLTYNGILSTQIYRGVEHVRNNKQTSPASTLTSAIKQGGKIGGAVSSIQQGALIGGKSTVFDLGKSMASVFTTLPKINAYIDEGMKAYQKENYRSYKSWLRGAKNVADLTKSTAGAIKDIASGLNNAGLVGAESVQIISGGAVAPMAGTVVGAAETLQGAYKLTKAYKNYTGLGKRNSGQGIIGDNTLTELQKIQIKKMTRAGVKTALGAITAGGGITAYALGGPYGLLTATIAGATVASFHMGKLGIQKLMEQMQSQEAIDNKKAAKKAAQSQLAGNIADKLEASRSDEEKDLIFSSLSLNDDKKDSAVQKVYNDVLEKYLQDRDQQIQALTDPSITQPTQPVPPEFVENNIQNRNTIQILELKGEIGKLKQEVSWNQLDDHRFFPLDFAMRVKKAAIAKALNKF
ncbi:MAG: DUF4157 domain-containing protein [Nostoc sp. NMS4]|nr:DUF4157 domain-containing protein [Nostoc sp. NMS4]